MLQLNGIPYTSPCTHHLLCQPLKPYVKVTTYDNTCFILSLFSFVLCTNNCSLLCLPCVFSVMSSCFLLLLPLLFLLHFLLVIIVHMQGAAENQLADVATLLKEHLYTIQYMYNCACVLDGLLRAPPKKFRTDYNMTQQLCYDVCHFFSDVKGLCVRRSFCTGKLAVTHSYNELVLPRAAARRVFIIRPGRWSEIGPSLWRKTEVDGP